MDYARKWEYCVVSTERIDEIVNELREFQVEKLKERRCKAVEISKCNVSMTAQYDNWVYIHIGASTITLNKVVNSNEINLI